jgi:hypothetical protein
MYRLESVLLLQYRRVINIGKNIAYQQVRYNTLLSFQCYLYNVYLLVDNV